MLPEVSRQRARSIAQVRSEVQPGTPQLGCPRKELATDGTLAAAVGLGLRLWVVGLVVWLVGHLLAVWAAKRDAQIVDVARRHLRFPTWFGV